MKKCCICKRNIWSWNRFYRKYGSCKVINKKTFKLEGIIYFCSVNCYEKTLTIQQKQSKIFFNFFEKSNGEWISLKERR